MTRGERGAQVANDIIALINSSPRTPTTEEMMLGLAEALKRANFFLADGPGSETTAEVRRLAEICARAKIARERCRKAEDESAGLAHDKRVAATTKHVIAYEAACQVERKLLEAARRLSPDELLALVEAADAPIPKEAAKD